MNSCCCLKDLDLSPASSICGGDQGSWWNTVQR